jgi:hypothetical protein
MELSFGVNEDLNPERRDVTPKGNSDSHGTVLHSAFSM